MVAMDDSAEGELTEFQEFCRDSLCAQRFKMLSGGGGG